MGSLPDSVQLVRSLGPILSELSPSYPDLDVGACLNPSSLVFFSAVLVYKFSNETNIYQIKNWWQLLKGQWEMKLPTAGKMLRISPGGKDI